LCVVCLLTLKELLARISPNLLQDGKDCCIRDHCRMR